MASAPLLILTVFSLALMLKQNVADSPAEVYWKSRLGSDAIMPKIVKDALIGADGSAQYAVKHMIQNGFTLSKELERSIIKDAEIEEYLIHPGQTPLKNSTIDPTKHSVYFVETDLIRPGKTLKLNFMKVEDDAKFFPIRLAKSIPFSSSELPQVLTYFSVNPNSSSAAIMKQTLESCETKAMSDEMKFCATTLEDMVDYVTSHVGNNVSTLSGYMERDVQNVHRIVGAKKIDSDVSTVCHKMGYPYAVFYCHNLKETNLYDVSMVDSEGTKMNAIGVCHKDTSSWSPLHVSYQLLKVKPGSGICHFLNERTLAYVRK